MDGTRPTKVTSEQTIEYGEVVLGGLKGFQRKTAEYAFERLYKASCTTSMKESELMSRWSLWARMKRE